MLYLLRLPQQFVKSSQTLQVVQGEPQVSAKNPWQFLGQAVCSLSETDWTEGNQNSGTEIWRHQFHTGWNNSSPGPTPEKTMHQIPFLSSDNVVLTLLQDFFAFRINGGCIWLRQSVGQNLHYAPGYLEETKQEKKILTAKAETLFLTQLAEKPVWDWVHATINEFWVILCIWALLLTPTPISREQT